jgi:glycosyltransferase involved in cell wall biosynthesis
MARDDDRLKISAFLITKNEAAKIDACLDSLDWIDEIIVVDDLSVDGTDEICRRRGVRFEQRPFTGFKDQKSYAMSLTTNDWVLEIDADERVSPEMQESILSLTPVDLAVNDCFEFKRLTNFWGKWIRHSSFYPDYKGRLYNKHHGAWSKGNVHERFIPQGTTRRLAGDIIHDQNLDLLAYLQRTTRYANLSALDLHAQGKRVKWHHVSIRPIYTFIYRYVIRRGYLDGMHGLVISVMGGIGTFLKYMRLYEIQRKLLKVPDAV